MPVCVETHMHSSMQDTAGPSWGDLTSQDSYESRRILPNRGCHCMDEYSTESVTSTEVQKHRAVLSNHQSE